jgi:hypothetical protein
MARFTSRCVDKLKSLVVSQKRKNGHEEPERPVIEHPATSCVLRKALHRLLSEGWSVHAALPSENQAPTGDDTFVHWVVLPNAETVLKRRLRHHIHQRYTVRASRYNSKHTYSTTTPPSASSITPPIASRYESSEPFVFCGYLETIHKAAKNKNLWWVAK